MYAGRNGGRRRAQAPPRAYEARKIVADLPSFEPFQPEYGDPTRTSC